MQTAKTFVLVTLLAAGLACGGYNSKSTPITPPAAGTKPNIGALVPASATAGSSLGTNGLMATGTNFNSNATINWNGTALTTTFVSTTQLTATVPDADTASAGTAAVTVTNPGIPGGIYGGGTSPETSNSMTFTIN
jgi:hypothetical protein